MPRLSSFFTDTEIIVTIVALLILCFYFIWLNFKKAASLQSYCDQMEKFCDERVDAIHKSYNEELSKLTQELHESQKATKEINDAYVDYTDRQSRLLQKMDASHKEAIAAHIARQNDLMEVEKSLTKVSNELADKIIELQKQLSDEKEAYRVLLNDWNNATNEIEKRQEIVNACNQQIAELIAECAKNETGN